MTGLTDIESDALGEIGNIAMGSAATSVSALTNCKVQITSPQVEVYDQANLFEVDGPYVGVHVSYVTGLRGQNLFLLPEHAAGAIASLMMGGDGTDLPDTLGEIELSAVSEAMNQMMGSASTSMSEMFGLSVDITPPTTLFPFDPESAETDREGDPVCVVFRLQIPGLIDSRLMQIVNLDFAKELAERAMGSVAEPTAVSDEHGATTVQAADAAGEKAAGHDADSTVVDIPKKSQGGGVSMTTVKGRKLRGSGSVEVEDAGWAATPSAKRGPAAVGGAGGAPAGRTDVGLGNVSLELVKRLKIELSASMGSTRMTMEEVLNLAPGSLVKLRSLDGEPINILANDQVVAKGEVVVVDERFGVRITDVTDVAGRLESLNS